MTATNTGVSRPSPRRPRLVASLLSLALAILLVGAADAAAPRNGAIVRPDPLVSAVPVGGQVVVNLYVQDVQNLYALDIRLGFDPTVLEVLDANPGASGVQIQPLNVFLKPDFVARNRACNAADPTDPGCPVAGVARYAVTQVNPSAPVSGSGPVAAVTFKRLKPGVAALTILTHDLSDRDGIVIPSAAQDGRIELASRVKLYLPLIVR